MHRIRSAVVEDARSLSDGVVRLRPPSSRREPHLALRHNGALKRYRLAAGGHRIQHVSVLLHQRLSFGEVFWLCLSRGPALANRNNLAASGAGRIAEAAPVVHQLASLVEKVAALVRGLN